MTATLVQTGFWVAIALAALAVVLNLFWRAFCFVCSVVVGWFIAQL